MYEKPPALIVTGSMINLIHESLVEKVLKTKGPRLSSNGSQTLLSP